MVETLIWSSIIQPDTPPTENPRALDSVIAPEAAMPKRATSVAELCRELGVKPVTLYRYVDPKGNLRDYGRRVLSA
ncbi:hypothetical protein GCM10007094_43990 [Pseudovibrio japonicus]|uniref:Uncharacterized protein n=1 Tax=Pseudovibrio japonicus TaxID=366534 RepID=A0ABQ3EPX7_9HYPH|nr:hypothetical protein GCM10007094_43990 [Pseudovibrio japonicus]